MTRKHRTTTKGATTSNDRVDVAAKASHDANVETEKEERRRFSGIALLAIPRFLIMNILVFMATFVIWAMLQLLFKVPFLATSSSLSFSDYPRVVLVMTLVGFLAYPLMFMLPSTRWAYRHLHGFGFGGFRDRMHTKRTWSAWLKSAGIGIGLGLLLVAVNTGVSMLGGHLHTLQRTSGDTSTSITAAAADAVMHWHSDYLVECILLLICVFLIAPIVEEMFFRGFIGNSLDRSRLLYRVPEKARMVIMCVISGLLFGILHAQLSSSAAVSLSTIAQATIVGIIFNWVAVYHYHTLAPTMFAHATSNILSIVLVFCIGV